MGWFMRQVDFCLSDELNRHGARFLLFQCPVCGGNGCLPEVGAAQCVFCEGRGTSDIATVVFLNDEAFQKINNLQDEMAGYIQMSAGADIESCLIEIVDVLITDEVQALTSKGWDVKSVNDITCSVDCLGRYFMKSGRFVEREGKDTLFMSFSQRDSLLERDIQIANNKP